MLHRTICAVEIPALAPCPLFSSSLAIRHQPRISSSAADLLLLWLPVYPQSTAAFYEEGNLQHELAASKAYIHNPAKRFFDARVAGRQTWGVFENDFSRQH